MLKLVIKSTIIGFIIGSVFMVVAPLGLGISFIEYLKPVLIPGVSLMQLVGQTTVDSPFLMLGLFLNGLIYTVVALCFLLTRKYLEKRSRYL